VLQILVNGLLQSREGFMSVDARFYASFLNAMGTIGLITSNAVALISKLAVGDEKFDNWGWRIPFWFSGIFLLLSLLISRVMKESDMYVKLKSSGNVCKKPLVGAFTDKSNLYFITIALFGYLLGQQCLSTTVYVYTQMFIESSLKTESKLSFYLMTVSFASIVPIFILAGYLSDRIGRKTIITIGFLSSIITFYPIFLGLEHYGPFENPKSDILIPNPNYSPGMLSILIGSMNAMFAFTHGPGTALLVELFPTRTRYTSISIPYHISRIFGR
jgi:MFS family permease